MFKKINAYLDEHGGGIFIIDDLLWDWVPISDCNAKFCSWGFFKDFISSVVQFPLCLFSLCVVINMNNLDWSYRNYKLVRIMKSLRVIDSLATLMLELYLIYLLARWYIKWRLQCFDETNCRCRDSKWRCSG